MEVGEAPDVRDYVFVLADVGAERWEVDEWVGWCEAALRTLVLELKD